MNARLSMILVVVLMMTSACEPAGPPEKAPPAVSAKQPTAKPKPPTLAKKDKVVIPPKLKVNHPDATSCHAGQLNGCVAMGSKLLLGRDVRRSVLRAEAYFSAACHQKHRAGCHGWAVLLRDVIKSREAQIKSLALFKANCAGKYWASCGNMADMMSKGEGGLQDAKGALELAEKTCKAHDEPYSCVVAGRLLIKGKRWGIEPEPAKAAGYLKSACAKRGWESCTQLARLHETGQGVEKNPREARTYYARACEQGLRGVGCTDLARMMRLGLGGTKNLKGAYRMDEKACKAGLQLSCIAQAEALVAGEGVDANPKRGLAILNQHCKQKNRFACMKLKALQSNK